MPDSIDNATVLIVDDDPTNRAVMSRHLSRAGFQVVTASTAAEGLEAAVGSDLCIVDVRLPDRSGHDLVAELRAREATSTTPVVLRTSFDLGDATMIEGIERGADAYLVEPISRQLLLATVRNLIRQRLTLERLSMAVAATGVGAWTWNAASERVAWNDSLEQIHGLDPGTFPGTFDAFLATIHPEDRPEVLAHLEQVTSGASDDYAVLYRFLHTDGSIRWLQSRARARRSEGDELRVLSGVALDVTDRESRARVGHRLLDFGGTLAATVGADQVADLVVTDGRKVFDASGALLARFEGELLVPERTDGLAVTDTFRLRDEVLAALRAGRAMSGRAGELGIDVGRDATHLHVLPLVSGANLHGALVLAWPSPPGEHLMEPAATFANLVAQTLARARLAQEQRLLGERFLKSVRPPVHRSGRLQVRGRYTPAADSVRSAGDWMDIVDLGDGVISLIIGDVVGHGVEAAVRSAAVRHAVRAAVVATGDPARALAVADRSVPSRGVGFVSTALCAVLTPDLDEVVLASAGHPGPVVVTEGGATWLRVEPGPPLGSDMLRSGPPLTAHRLDEPWTMLLFTDGLIETRDTHLDANMDQLCQRLTDPRPAAVAAVLDEVGDNPADDVAVLVATTLVDP